jgi:hypothetical protein
MPSHIKAGLSIITLIVGALVHLYEKDLGNEQLSWIVAGLAVFMVLAMWIFPEAGKRINDPK